MLRIIQSLVHYGNITKFLEIISFRYFKIYKWLTTVRSYGHEIGIELASCDTKVMKQW